MPQQSDPKAHALDPCTRHLHLCQANGPKEEAVPSGQSRSPQWKLVCYEARRALRPMCLVSPHTKTCPNMGKRKRKKPSDNADWRWDVGSFSVRRFPPRH